MTTWTEREHGGGTVVHLDDRTWMVIMRNRLLYGGDWWIFYRFSLDGETRYGPYPSLDAAKAAYLMLRSTAHPAPADSDGWAKAS